MAPDDDFGFLRPPGYVTDLSTEKFARFRCVLPLANYPLLTIGRVVLGSNDEHEPVYRTPSHYNPLDTFKLPMGSNRHYQQQYGDMYFLRLAKLKPAVEQIATEAWEGFSVWTRFLPT